MVHSSGIMRIVSPCWRPATEEDSSSSDTTGRSDGLLWYKDLGPHASGEFSMAVIQANSLVEDQSQIESGPLSWLSSGPFGTYVGIYDGHGGPETSRYINEHLFKHLNKFASEQQGMTPDVIQKAFLATEEGFISLVRKQWQEKPQLASVGSCVLVGIVCGGNLYTANLGDSRVVLGRLEKALREVAPVQLSSEHNVGHESVRQELHELHPDDSQIVVLKHKVWRVKGIIQVSRSIGDAYLKNAEFNREPLISRFRLPEPFGKPILSAEPSIVVHKLQPNDLFLIFASDGLWEQLSNQEAVDIIHQYPRHGIARRLIKAALQEAAKKREMRYSDLKKIDRGVRRHFHDDITVVVLFLDPRLISKSSFRGPTISMKGGGSPAQANCAS
ncbi:probable protein phosphatase 2C 38 [Aristolochia californica]|uniref:probable protein phosphatase 2C 38 n=1 Tax=Aristolochia californica TaxID=171875 RepID=UPI0035DACAD7